MRVECPKCLLGYDDTYRLTICPHPTFEMKCRVVNSKDGYLGTATSLKELEHLRNKGK